MADSAVDRLDHADHFVIRIEQGMADRVVLKILNEQQFVYVIQTPDVFAERGVAGLDDILIVQEVNAIK